MIGLIVAIIMLIFKVELNSVLLAFIGLQLFTISEVNVSRWRQENAKRRAVGKAMEDLAKGLREAMHEHGRRNEKGSDRDQDGDGE